MKASLAMTKMRARMDPDQVGPGLCIQWAATRPRRSQRLNTRKLTGTKYFCQVESELVVSARLQYQFKDLLVKNKEQILT